MWYLFEELFSGEITVASSSLFDVFGSHDGGGINLESLSSYSLPTSFPEKQRKNNCKSNNASRNNKQISRTIYTVKHILCDLQRDIERQVVP